MKMWSLCCCLNQGVLKSMSFYSFMKHLLIKALEKEKAFQTWFGNLMPGLEEKTNMG